ncbi:hypothetical protein [Pseudodesulfovibrio senegalensis]|uniref:Uncharacterized protein n=1 Tax=Pseudodesulfovibrio senegalensis TaxID=1721087 RepID=A0A6N6N468_9BACT|nr:hypothetical protein [Pseudodesulfovibrio senegalensis]KAB1441883.1 hypothetical protein F8A88_09880 [Pseudodesulfovibrio senegalensis]
MEDFERAALLEAVHQWYAERFGIARFSFGPSRVLFYDRILQDELEGDDPLYELDPALWTEPNLWLNLFWSLVWGAGLTALTMVLLGFWSWSVLLWLGASIGLLAVFPCVMMQATRTAVVIEGDQQGSGQDDVSVTAETVRQVALAHMGRGFGRWLVHCLVDAALVVQWASFTRGVARLVAEEYASGKGGAVSREHLPLREKRGAALAEKIVAAMDGDGLKRLVCRY